MLWVAEVGPGDPFRCSGQEAPGGAGPGKRPGIDPPGAQDSGSVLHHTGVCQCANSWQGCTCRNLAPGLMLLPPSPFPRDQLNALRREKQKLVEKIMDQYRVLEPGPLPRTK